jgi:hypothetical protein
MNSLAAIALAAMLTPPGHFTATGQISGEIRREPNPPVPYDCAMVLDGHVRPVGHAVITSISLTGPACTAKPLPGPWYWYPNPDGFSIFLYNPGGGACSKFKIPYTDNGGVVTLGPTDNGLCTLIGSFTTTPAIITVTP